MISDKTVYLIFYALQFDRKNNVVIYTSVSVLTLDDFTRNYVTFPTFPTFCLPIFYTRCDLTEKIVVYLHFRFCFDT